MEHLLYQNSQFRMVKVQNSEINQLDKVQGRWNQHQHYKFIQAVIRYGKDWKKVQDFVATRTGSQVRSHAQKYFIKIVKIMKDRKKLKGRKIPDITDTEKELNQYFKENNHTQNTPKQILELMKLDSFSKRKSQDKLQNEDEIQKTKEQRHQFFLKNNYNGKSQKKKIIESIQLQCGQDESIFTSIMRKNFDYFVNGGDFSGLIDFGIQQKKSIQEEETSNRKCSFIQFDDNENQKQFS